MNHKEMKHGIIFAAAVLLLALCMAAVPAAADDKYLGTVYAYGLYDFDDVDLGAYSTWTNDSGETVTFLPDNAGKYYIDGAAVVVEGDYSFYFGGDIYHITVLEPTAAITGSVYKDSLSGELIGGLIGSVVRNDQYITIGGPTEIALTNPDGTLTAVNLSVFGFDPSVGSVRMLDLGVWTAQTVFWRGQTYAELGGVTITQYAPDFILGKPYYFTIVSSDSTKKLEALTPEIIQGGFAIIGVTAPVGVWTVSVEDGSIPEGQPNVNNINSRNGFCYADITVPSSGVSSFVVKSTSTSNIKVRLYNQGSDTIAKAITIMVSSGSITAEAEQVSVFIGNEFDVYGTNDFGGTLYFFIKGTNFPFSTINQFGMDLTASGKVWDVTVDTSQIKRESGKKPDAGTYTIYVVKLADGVSVNQISDCENLDNETLVYAYTTVSFALKQPFISLTKTPEVLVQGDKFEATGTAEGSPLEVMYYIFGTNYFKSGYSLVINSKFTVELAKTETKKDKMAAGQYFIIVQHPMYDYLFNVGPVADGSGSYNIVLNKHGAFNDGDNLVLFRTQERQSANAAQALCDALDSQDIDDMYVKASFIVAGPTSYIDAIPSHITKGDILTVSGTTTGHVGDVVCVELLSTAFAALPKEVVGDASFVAKTTTIGETGVWSISFDTSTLNADEYTCSVAVGQLDATSSKVTITDDTLPISLTVDKTSLYVSQEVSAVDVCFTYVITGDFTSAELSFGDGSQPVSLTESTGMIMHTYNLNAPSYSDRYFFSAMLTVNSGSSTSIKHCSIVVTKESGSSGGGGFTVKKEAIISPSGSLIPGDRVTASMEIKLPQGSVDTASKLSFDTPLAGDVWTVDIIKGGTIVNTKHPAPPYLYISGFDLDYDADVTVRINVDGIVPSDASGKEISVIMIRAAGMHSSGLSTYNSPKQFVYNPNNLHGELAVLGNAITTLDTRIAAYMAYERDTGKAQPYTEQARSKYLAAQNAGTADVATAFANIEAGNKLVKQAQMELALTALSMSLSYTTSTDNVITALYSKGRNTEAVLVDTKNSGLKNIYSRLLAVYNAGNVPDAASLDKLAADSLALWNEANGYLETGLLESLTLSSGWNFISVPTKLAAVNDTASELFAGVNTDNKAPLIYNAESKLWEQVTASTEIKPLNAYWIYSVDEITLTPEFDRGAHTPGLKTLKKGWNAVGLSAENPMPASVAFNGLNWRTYLSWNAAGQKYDSPFVKGVSGTYGEENPVSLWKGGWIYMEEDGTYLGYA